MMEQPKANQMMQTVELVYNSFDAVTASEELTGQITSLQSRIAELEKAKEVSQALLEIEVSL